MLYHAIKITAFDRPMPTVRQVAATNVGIYCRCGEFVAFSVMSGESAVELEVMADQPVPVLCPYCGTKEQRHAEDIRDYFDQLSRQLDHNKHVAAQHPRTQS